MLDIFKLYQSGQLFDGQYKLICPLSTAGGSADVWLAIDVNTIDEDGDESTATEVAIKIYRPKNLFDLDGEFQFKNEFKKVFNCHHENIIKPTYFSVFEESPYLVMPYCPSGSAENLMGNFTKTDDIWKFIYEVSSGLAYLHEHSPQIIHQDIKPANVLIDDNGNFAITDFGISAAKGGIYFESEEESGGTYAYMAPERFLNTTKPMPESDIWAFGATLYELITTQPPFGEEGGAVQKKNSQIPPIKADIPDSIKQMIYDCLAYSPNERPTAREIVDTVLKKRYSRNKHILSIILTVAISAIAAGLVFALLYKPEANPEEVFAVNCQRGDSIVNSEISIIQNNDGDPTLENIKGLDQALVIYKNACKDVPDDVKSKPGVIKKVALINDLVSEISKYDSIANLTNRAKRTNMEDLYIENSLKQEKSKQRINSIITKINKSNKR